MMRERWVENILTASLGLQPGERLVVLNDLPLQAAGAALVDGAREMGAAEARQLMLAPTGLTFTLVKSAFLQAVREADLLVSLRSNLDLRGEDPQIRAAMSAFREVGRGRWASLAQVDHSVLHQELSADFGAIAVEAERLAAALAKGSLARVTSEAGTDLTLRYTGRPVHVETGLIRAPGAIGNLPAGEVFVAPLEESAEGRLVVDLCVGDIRLDQPVTLTFRQGRVVRVDGGRAAVELKARLGDEDWAWTIGEFGVGANPHVVPRGRVATDEKALGTAHIALGSNRSFGGQNPAETHYDCVIAGAQIEVDNIGRIGAPPGDPIGHGELQKE